MSGRRRKDAALPMHSGSNEEREVLDFQGAKSMSSSLLRLNCALQMVLWSTLMYFVGIQVLSLARSETSLARKETKLQPQPSSLGRFFDPHIWLVLGWWVLVAVPMAACASLGLGPQLAHTYSREILKGRAYDADKTSGQRGLGFHRSISSAVQAIENAAVILPL